MLGIESVTKSINNIYIGKSIVLPESNPIIIVNISAKLLDNE